MDEDEPDSPYRQQNITPRAPSDQEPTLHTLLEAIQQLTIRVDDNQRQIQDLVALFARTNSPPARVDRFQSPTTLRRPSPIRETRFGTAPPNLYGPPRRQYEREYTYEAPNLVRAGTVAPEARFDTSPPEEEEDIYSQPHRQPQPQPRNIYFGRERMYSPPTFAGRELDNVSKRNPRCGDHGKEQGQGILTPAATLAKEEAPGDELDVLNCMATDKDQCEKNGHFQRNCSHKGHDKDERKGWERARRQFKGSSSFESRKPSSQNRVTENGSSNDDSSDSSDSDDDDSAYQEQSFRSDSSDSDDDYGQEQSSLSFCSDCSNSDGDYGYQEQSSCCSMEMSGSDGDAASDAASDEEGLDGKHTAQDNLYEISSNGLEARTPRSTVLPIYDGHIAGTTRHAIVNSETSTLHIGQRIVQESGLQATKIKARRVKIADHSRCTVDRIATVNVKVGNLPTESLTANIFPLKDDDEGYESSNMHGDEYEDEYRDSEPSTHNFVMSHQRHKNHGQVLRDGREGERQR
jgi:hypothetical protein